MDPWCPPQEGSSWVPGRPSEANTGLAGGLGWHWARSFPSWALSGAHPLTLPEASALQQTEPKSCVGSSDPAGMEEGLGKGACLSHSFSLS